MDVAAHYDTISAAYVRAVTEEELWTHTTFYTFTNYILGGNPGALKGAAVLDLDRGSGLFSHWAATQGASRVVGVDISEEQIRRAQEIERNDPASGAGNGNTVEYLVRDVSDIGVAEVGQFDVAIAAHVLCYAQGLQELRRMIKVASSCLRVGGRFVGVRECLDSAAKGKVAAKVKRELEGRAHVFLQTATEP